MPKPKRAKIRKRLGLTHSQEGIPFELELGLGHFHSHLLTEGLLEGAIKAALSTTKAAREVLEEGPHLGNMRIFHWVLRFNLANGPVDLKELKKALNLPGLR